MPLCFDTSVTIGASPIENGNPFRYFTGTIRNLKVKMSAHEKSKIIPIFLIEFF